MAAVSTRDRIGGPYQCRAALDAAGAVGAAVSVDEPDARAFRDVPGQDQRLDSREYSTCNVLQKKIRGRSIAYTEFSRPLASASISSEIKFF